MTEHELFSSVTWDARQALGYISTNVSDELAVSIFRLAGCSETPTPIHQIEHIRSHKNVRFQSSVTLGEKFQTF